MGGVCSRTWTGAVHFPPRHTHTHTNTQDVIKIVCHWFRGPFRFWNYENDRQPIGYMRRFAGHEDTAGHSECPLAHRRIGCWIDTHFLIDGYLFLSRSASPFSADLRRLLRSTPWWQEVHGHHGSSIAYPYSRPLDLIRQRNVSHVFSLCLVYRRQSDSLMLVFFSRLKCVCVSIF